MATRLVVLELVGAVAKYSELLLEIPGWHYLTIGLASSRFSYSREVEI